MKCIACEICNFKNERLIIFKTKNVLPFLLKKVDCLSENFVCKVCDKVAKNGDRVKNKADS